MAATGKPRKQNLSSLQGPREGRPSSDDMDWGEVIYDKMVYAFVLVMRIFCTWAVPYLQPVLDKLVHYICEPVLGRLTGSFYPPKAFLHFGQQPVSFISVTDPEFGVPLLEDKPQLKGQPVYNPSEFPFEIEDSDPYGFHEWVAHFLILCAKVAYERETLIKAVVNTEFNKDRKGFKWVDSFHTEPKEAASLTMTERAEIIKGARADRVQMRVDHNLPKPKPVKHEHLTNKVAAGLLPDTMAYMITNAYAVILVFRGTEPHKLAQWWSDCDLELAERNNAHGFVHPGFWEALFYQAPNADRKGQYPSVFNRICKALDEQTKYNEKRIYITGHSLGAGLTAMFAHTLAHKATSEEELLHRGVGYSRAGVLAERVGGVYTFASPTVGDHVFSGFLVQTYGASAEAGRDKDKLFRVTHSSDVVTKIPFGQGYRHHKLEYYITYKGDIHHDAEDIAAWRVCESDQFDALYLWKVVAGWDLWSPWGAPNGSWLMPDLWVFFVRCLLHTVIRVLCYVLGPLIPGHVISGVPDHFPSDYERKIRRVAVDLRHLLDADAEDRPSMRTHLLSRVEKHYVEVKPAATTVGTVGIGLNTPNAKVERKGLSSSRD